MSERIIMIRPAVFELSAGQPNLVLVHVIFTFCHVTFINYAFNQTITSKWAGIFVSAVTRSYIICGF